MMEEKYRFTGHYLDTHSEGSLQGDKVKGRGHGDTLDARDYSDENIARRLANGSFVPNTPESKVQAIAEGERLAAEAAARGEAERKAAVERALRRPPIDELHWRVLRAWGVGYGGRAGNRLEGDHERGVLQGEIVYPHEIATTKFFQGPLDEEEAWRAACEAIMHSALAPDTDEFRKAAPGALDYIAEHGLTEHHRIAAAKRYAACEEPTEDDLRLLNVRVEDIHEAMYRPKEMAP